MTTSQSEIDGIYGIFALFVMFSLQNTTKWTKNTKNNWVAGGVIKTASSSLVCYSAVAHAKLNAMFHLEQKIGIRKSPDFFL